MNNAKKEETIKNRQVEQKGSFIEHLKKMPILQIAIEKTGISRATYYRWRNEGVEFRKLVDEAIVEGEALITDIPEKKRFHSRCSENCCDQARSCALALRSRDAD